MVELVLAYAGAVFIGFEFVRKFTKIQALFGMLVGWPWDIVRRYISKPQNTKVPMYVFVALLVIFGPLTLVLLIASVVILYPIWFIIILLNTFHKAVNRLYRYLIDRYEFLILPLAGGVLASRRMDTVSEEEVVQKMIESEIPVVPLTGVLLITIAFVMQIV